jgi:hypothetical protein
VELIPPGFHDETDQKLDAYPVIADDMDLLYIEEDTGKEWLPTRTPDTGWC